MLPLAGSQLRRVSALALAWTGPRGMAAPPTVPTASAGLRRGCRLSFSLSHVAFASPSSITMPDHRRARYTRASQVRLELQRVQRR